MDNTIDLLQIKIEGAKALLSKETLNAINAVNWKIPILKLKEKKGFSIEQLGDLELETELLLCGLLSPEDYPKELENRMHLTKNQVNEIVNEMNEQVFSKIKEEMMKRTERKETFEKKENSDNQILNSAGIQIVEEPRPAPTQPRETVHPILAQKLSSSVQAPTITTEHTLNNITKTGIPTAENAKTSKPYIDPYREIPE